MGRMTSSDSQDLLARKSTHCSSNGAQQTGTKDASETSPLLQPPDLIPVEVSFDAIEQPTIQQPIPKK